MCISKASLTPFAKGNLVRGCVKQTNKHKLFYFHLEHIQAKAK